jgi:RNA polymerase sigma-70 factor, ECF subfamily
MGVRRRIEQLMAASEHPSDEELIARIAGGDRDAFAVLYRRRRPDVYRFALLVAGSAAVADDVTQDVFMAVIHHAGRFRADRSGAVPWLFGITRNHVRRAQHSRQRAVSLPDAESTEPRRLAIDCDPLAGLARQEHMVALRRALLTLPSKFREAIVLCDLQELSYADAAGALGCAIGTVRSRLHRGRALLAARLRATDEPLFQKPLTRWIL